MYEPAPAGDFIESNSPLPQEPNPHSNIGDMSLMYEPAPAGDFIESNSPLPQEPNAFIIHHSLLTSGDMSQCASLLWLAILSRAIALSH